MVKSTWGAVLECLHIILESKTEASGKTFCTGNANGERSPSRAHNYSIAR